MFIPLHIYSEYSFLQSGITLEKLFPYAKKLNFRGLGLCDLEAMHGLPHFEALLNANNLDGAYGMDVHFHDTLLSLFIVNESGYNNLVQITNAIHGGRYTPEFLLAHADGLLGIISSSSIDDNDISHIIELKPVLYKLYLGLEIYAIGEKVLANKLKEQFRLLEIPSVAFPHIKYLKKEDAIVLDIAQAIDQETQLTSKQKVGETYFRTMEELDSLYDEDDCQTTRSILSLCHFEITKNRGKLLKFSENSRDLLRKKCLNGLDKKNLAHQKYLERLNYELEVIDKMGYNDYFLIVQDYVEYAKCHDIYVGPGRGSAAGSLVAFALDITTPDPIKYDLLFERFLNPSRVTMPDIDVDFEDIHREDIIAYIMRRYGKERVANIITYQTIGAKQALRDIGRVFNYATYDIDFLSKSLGSLTVTFRDAYRHNPTFRKLVDSEPLYLEIVTLASKIEGLIRQSGLHAAGIVLNDEPIAMNLPVLTDEDGFLTTQYEMNFLEQQGFLKMDILSLRNLTIIHRIMRLIGRDDYYNLPIDDRDALALITKNVTMGIFQLESPGMKKAIATLEPSTFEDVVALLALFRPGPMEAIPLYAERKKGQPQITYANSTMEKILSPTYGIIVYQEQIIQIAVQMAGFTLADADNFRRAISKKDNEKLRDLKDKFINGSISLGYSKKNAEEVFNHIEKFANYGFNRAHSVGYAIISTQMAYLKAHYKLPFFAAIMDSEGSFNNPKFNDYLYEFKQLNISIMPPNINHSTEHYEVCPEGLLFPLSNIRGLPKNIINAILLDRQEHGLYHDFFTFIERLLPQKMNEAHISKLINSGALDDFGNRATLRASIPNALMNAKFSTMMQGNLHLDGLATLHYEMVSSEPTPEYDLEQEFECLGLMISGSPLDLKKDALIKAQTTTFALALSSNEMQKIAGIIKTVKTIKTRNNEQMAYLSLINESESIDITIFPSTYSQCWQMLKANNIIVIEGKKDYKRDNTFIAMNLYLLED